MAVRKVKQINKRYIITVKLFFSHWDIGSWIKKVVSIEA